MEDNRLTDYQILDGDCIGVMRGMEADSVDALVTDPPAGISFMNKSWDSNRGSRNAVLTLF